MTKITRRRLLGGAAAIFGGAAVSPWVVERCECEGDDESSIEEIYERGLVDVSESHWARKPGDYEPYAKLEQSVDVSVALVGAGHAGSSLALYLAEAGVDVALVEARQPGWGASGRSAGHLSPYLASLKPLERFPNGGKAFLEFFLEHADLNYRIAKEYSIACDAVQAGVILAAQFASTSKSLDEKARHWNEKFTQPVRTLHASDMKGLTGSSRWQSGIIWEKGGHMNPYLFTNGVVAAAARQRAQVFGDSPVTNMERTGSRWRLLCDGGEIVADKVVLCTNAYSSGLMPDADQSFSPSIAYGLSTRPLPQSLREIIMPGGAVLQQKPLNMHSFIVDTDGRIVTALLPRRACPSDPAPHFNDLLRWLNKAWPETREYNIELENYWTGAIAMSPTDFPRILQLGEGAFSMSQFNSKGFLLAPIFAKHFAEVLARDDLAGLAIPLDRPERLAFPGMTDFLLRRVMVPSARLAERLSIL